MVDKTARDFTDPIIGRCKFKDSFYVTNDLYGGYSYDCEKGSGMVDYANAESVIELARNLGFKVHLASGAWKEIDREGFGEKVSAEEARFLLNELKRKRR